MQLQSIVVRHVIERNNGAGRKSFLVSGGEYDETSHPLYQMNSGWIPPHMKLELASVAVGDTVSIVQRYHPENPSIGGDFIQNLSDTRNRNPICRCGTMLVSDGFTVYCRNVDCGLSRLARFQRLARIEFFSFEALHSDNELFNMFMNDSGYQIHSFPFRYLEQGMFWGYPGGSVEHLLLQQRFNVTNLSTFLVKSLFEEFLENPQINQQFVDASVKAIDYLYGVLHHTMNRRMVHDDGQDLILKKFIWALGIESMSPYFVEAMIAYEKDSRDNRIEDTAYIFAWALTHPHDLIRDYGVTRHEADLVKQEVIYRKHDLHDILFDYALCSEDVTATFNGTLG